MYSYVLEKEVGKMGGESSHRDRSKLYFLEDMLALVSVLSTESIWAPVPQHDQRGQKMK
jgi:hypothetical protein